LLAGHLVADDAHLGARRTWLDARGSQLAQGQRVFAEELGVCPGFFRPAHGLHTPVLAVAGERRNMRLVTWDVRADDRRTDDAATLAHRALDDIGPGSIVAVNLYG